MHKQEPLSLETVLAILGQSVFLFEQAQEILSEPLEVETDSVIAATLGDCDEA